MRQIITGIALSVIAVASSGASDPDDCRRIADDATRLACYDAAFDAAPIPTSTNREDPTQDAASPTVPPAAQAAAPRAQPASSVPQTAPNSPAAPAVSPDALFGKADAANSEVLHKVYGVPNVEAIESTVAELHKGANGRYVLALANGQVWAQTDDTVMSLAVGATIRIRHGAMGSFLLGTGSTKKTMRVKRTD